MIDPESEVFSRVVKDVRKVYPDLYISGEYINSPPQFPNASIEMTSNIPSNVDSGEETKSEVTFDINVYSNLRMGKKKEAKAIASVMDEAMQKMNFVRVAYSAVPNMADSTIYRITMRYRAVCDGNYFYRR